MENIIQEIKVCFKQEPDCCDLTQSDQELTLEVGDGGAGAFYILSTKRWAIESPEEFFKILKRFERIVKREYEK